MINAAKSASLSPPRQRHRVKPTAKHRITAQKSQQNKRQALQRAKPINRLDAVVGARRIKPAARRPVPRDISLIKFYQPNQKILHHKKARSPNVNLNMGNKNQPSAAKILASANFLVSSRKTSPIFIDQVFFLATKTTSNPGRILGKSVR